MANVENIEKRILKLVDTDSPCAIALTGEWGIGKTHLWKKFRDENKEVFAGKKYAYVSLFGLDSLESLKLAIATEVHTETNDDSLLNVDVSKHLKKLFGFVGGGSAGTSGDMRFGINIGNKLVTNIIMSHLKNTLVCLDDIERKSDSLPMSEILGLVNYLRNERKCQVLMIMHDEESKDKDYFDKHKEKVFDEILILNNSLSIVGNIIDNNELLPIYENFYKTLEVKNLRFYQRAQKMFKAITDNSNNELSITSKKQVLQALLIILAAYDMPSILGDNIDFDFFINSFTPYRVNNLRHYRIQNAYKSDNQRLNDIEEIEEARKFEIMDTRLSSFYRHFELSNWSKVVTDLLIDLDTDAQLIEKLSQSDEITEAQLKSDRVKQELMTEYRSLNSGNDFNQRFFDNIKHRIDREAFPNLSFYHNTLKKNGAPELANQFEELVKKHIEVRVAQGPKEWFIGDYYLRIPVSPDLFYNFLLQTISNQKEALALNTDANTMSEVFMRFCQSGNDSEDFFEAIQNISKENFSSVVWQPLGDGIDRIRYIQELLKHPAFRVDIVKLNNGNRIDTATWHYKKPTDIQKLSPFSYQPFLFESKLKEVKQWTLELLQERVVEKPNSRAAVEHLLELTNNLENI